MSFLITWIKAAESWSDLCRSSLCWCCSATRRRPPSGCFCCECSWRSSPHNWSPAPAGRHTDAVNARLRLERRAQYAHRLLTINLCVFSRWPRRPGQPWWSFPPLAGRRAERLWILSHRLSLQTYQTEPLHRRKQKRTHADFSTDGFKKLKSTKNKSRSVFCYLLVFRCRCRGFCTSSAASAAACLHSSGPPAGQSQPSESVDGTCPPTAGCHTLLWVMEMIVLGQKKKR